METTTTATRIHPLMAAAAVSVIAVSLAGAAAITGLIPNSQAVPAPVGALPPSAMVAGAPVQVAPAQYLAQAPAQYAPPAAQLPQQSKPVHHAPQRHTQLARNDYRAPVAQPVAQPAQPNYLGIGAGALIGGILGNQVGSGNGRKLATVAGAIGGGMLGNEVANRNK